MTTTRIHTEDGLIDIELEDLTADQLEDLYSEASEAGDLDLCRLIEQVRGW